MAAAVVVEAAESEGTLGAGRLTPANAQAAEAREEETAGTVQAVAECAPLRKVAGALGGASPAAQRAAAAGCHGASDSRARFVSTHSTTTCSSVP